MLRSWLCLLCLVSGVLVVPRVRAVPCVLGVPGALGALGELGVRVVPGVPGVIGVLGAPENWCRSRSREEDVVQLRPPGCLTRDPESAHLSQRDEWPPQKPRPGLPENRPSLQQRQHAQPRQ